MFEVNNKKIVCDKCGTVASELHKFCSVCGNSIQPQSIPEENNIIDTEDDKYKIWLKLAFWSLPISFLFDGFILGGKGLIFVGFAVSIFSIVYARIKYPNEKVKKSFRSCIVIFLISVILAFVLFGFVIVSCINCTKNL